MTIIKQINRKKRNQKLFNKLMAFYFAIVSISACGYITALADGNSYELKGKPVAVLENVEIVTGLKNAFRGVGYFFLRILAEIVTDFEKAVDILLSLNLYDLIDKYFKIDTWGKNIAAGVISIALMFVAVLLIFNADKTRLTDFGRGIIISVTLIIALPVLIKSLGKLQKIGVDESKQLVGAEQLEYVTNEGTVGKMSLGELLLAYNIVDVDESVLKNELVFLSETKGFTQNPNKIFALDYNRVSHNIIEKVENVIPNVKPQKKYSELDEKAKIILCGNGTEELYNQYKDGYSVAKDNYEKYKNKTDEERNADKYHPHTLTRKMWTYDDSGNSITEVYTYLEEETKTPLLNYMNLIGNEKARWAEYGISQCMVTEAIYKLYHAGIIKDEPYTTYLNRDDFGGGELGQLFRDAKGNRLDIQKTVQRMENIKLKAGNDIEYSVLEWLNISNNKEVYANAEEVAKQSSQFTVISELKKYNKIEDIPDWIDYAWHSIVTWGHADEYVYKYNFNFLRAAFELIIVGICLLFAGLKIASTLFDIVFARLIAPIVIASDLHGSGRAKQMIQNLLSSYLILITVVLLLRIYIMVLFAIKKDGSAIGNNLAAELMIMLGGAKFVIDGPDLIVKLLGIDAGVKSGLGTLMGVRTAANMARGAAHTVSNVGRKAANIGGGAVGGAVGGGTGAHRHAYEQGRGTVVNSVAGSVAGAVGGAFSGAFGNRSRGNAFERGMNTGETVGRSAVSPISDIPSEVRNTHANQQAVRRNGGGGHGGAGGNNGGATGGTGGHGGAGGNTTVIAGGKGEKGDTGAKGDKGDKGEQGVQGIQGRQGEKGEDANKNEGFAQRELRNEQMRGHGLDD